MKKQILFLLTLLLAFTPACKQQKQRLAGANCAIAAGTIFTAGGISTGTAAGVLIATTAPAGPGAGLAALAPLLTIGPLMIAAPILFAIGIPLLVIGIKNRKKVKTQQLLEKLKQEQQAREEKELEEKETYTNEFE